jgi:hypothetical protein
MALRFGSGVVSLRLAGMSERRYRVFQGIVENSFRKRPRRELRERALSKEFSKRLWENGGNPAEDPSESWKPGR